MNPQPDTYVGQVFAFIFVCMVLYYAIKAYLENSGPSFSDSFVIGHFVDEPSTVKFTRTTTTTTPTYIPTNNNVDPPDNGTEPPDSSSGPDPIKPVPSQPKKKKHQNSSKTNQPKKNKSVFEMQQLHIDCVDALYALGMKKSESKKRMQQIFGSMNNPPKTVQDFLMIALRK